MGRWTLTLLLLGLVISVSSKADRLNCFVSHTLLRSYYHELHLQMEQPYRLSVINEVVSENEMRRFHKLTLQSEAPFGSIEVTLAFPKESRARQLPVLLVLGGFDTGQRTVELVETRDDVVLVGYEYPGLNYFHQGDLEKMVESMTLVPLQIASLFKWLSEQSWAISERVQTLGVSLGALYLPISQRVLKIQGQQPFATIFAFGGGDFGAILGAELRGHADAATIERAVSLARGLTYLVDPRTHLPCLPQGHYLTLSALRDEIFPEESRKIFEELTPQTNEVIRFDETHIHPQKSEMIREVSLVISDWLRRLQTL